MTRQGVGAHGEHDRGLGPEHHRGEHRCQTVAGARRGRRGPDRGRPQRREHVGVASRAMVDEAVLDAAAAAADPDDVLADARPALIAAKSENPGGTEDEAAGVASEILTELDAASRSCGPGPVGRASSRRSGDGRRARLERAPGRRAGRRSPAPGTTIRGAARIDDGDGSSVAARRHEGPDRRGARPRRRLPSSRAPRSPARSCSTSSADEELAGLHGTQVLLERGLPPPARGDRRRAERVAGRPRRARRSLAHRDRLGKAAHGLSPIEA